MVDRKGDPIPCKRVLPHIPWSMSKSIEIFLILSTGVCRSIPGVSHWLILPGPGVQGDSLMNSLSFFMYSILLAKLIISLTYHLILGSNILRKG